MARPGVYLFVTLLCFCTSVAKAEAREEGPYFIKEPEHLWFADGSWQVILRCSAVGNPRPKLEWQRLSPDGKASKITSAKGHYTSTSTTSGILNVIHGELGFYTPQEADAGRYQCLASNKFGTIVSGIGRLQKAFINEFSWTPRPNINVNLHMNASIDCQAPAHRPAANYTWYKDVRNNTIRSDKKPHTFNSKNGKLYFSYVTSYDQGYYYCNATVAIPGYKKSKTSRGIQLVVGTGGGSRRPKIHRDFPAGFPRNPHVGDNVTLECFATGTGNLHYSWYREYNSRMSKRVTFSDRNRTLTIHNIQQEDAGIYGCMVTATGKSGETGTDTKKIFHLAGRLPALPKFRKPLRNINAVKGSRFILHCEAEGYPPPAISSLKNGKPFDYSMMPSGERNRIKFYTTANKTNVVSFKRAERHDAGMYQCAALNNNLVTIYSSSWVQVEDSYRKTPPEIVFEEKQNITFIPNKQLELLCDAKGFPKPKMWWKKDGKDINYREGDRVHMIEGLGTLFINRPGQTDQGVYQCLAKNELGVAVTQKTRLTMAYIEKDITSAFAEEHKVQVGKPLTLKCTPPKSLPLSHLTWTVEHSDGSNTEVIFSKRVSMDLHGNLHFANVEKNDTDAGGGRAQPATYKCLILNNPLRRGEAGSKAKIIVEGDNPVPRRPTILYSSPSNVIAMNGTKHILKCIFSAMPTADTRWFGKYNETIEATSRRVYTRGFGQELIFDPVTDWDAGIYRCEGKSNSSSMPTSKQFNVAIRSKPFWLTKPKNADYVQHQRRATFECSASGNPKPRMQWYINGVEIERSNEPYRMDRGALVFDRITLKDAKVIQCNASNQHGYVFANAYLNPLPVPVPPIGSGSRMYGTVFQVAMAVFLVLWLSM